MLVKNIIVLNLDNIKESELYPKSRRQPMRLHTLDPLILNRPPGSPDLPALAFNCEAL